MNDSRHLRITVFGGSTPKEDELAYQEAVRLGQLIGEQGWTVLTGGYKGTMEAVSRGTAEAGGHVVGVTSDEIETWRPIGPNAWVQEEWRVKTARERLYKLIDNCDAAIALPGGIGTLAEVAVLWSQMQILAVPLRSFILVGQGWQETFDQVFEWFQAYIPQGNQQLLHFVPDVDAAVKLLLDA